MSSGRGEGRGHRGCLVQPLLVAPRPYLAPGSPYGQRAQWHLLAFSQGEEETAGRAERFLDTSARGLKSHFCH